MERPRENSLPPLLQLLLLQHPQLLPLPKLLQLLLLLQFVQPPEDMQVRKIILEQFAILNMPGEFISVNSSSQTGLEKVMSNILVINTSCVSPTTEALVSVFTWSYSPLTYSSLRLVGSLN